MNVTTRWMGESVSANDLKPGHYGFTRSGQLFLTAHLRAFDDEAAVLLSDPGPSTGPLPDVVLLHQLVPGKARRLDGELVVEPTELAWADADDSRGGILLLTPEGPAVTVKRHTGHYSCVSLLSGLEVRREGPQLSAWRLLWRQGDEERELLSVDAGRPPSPRG